MDPVEYPDNRFLSGDSTSRGQAFGFAPYHFEERGTYGKEGNSKFSLLLTLGVAILMDFLSPTSAPLIY